MEKKTVVIVDTDEEYITSLEYHFLETWKGRIDLEVITQMEYYRQYFSQPRNIYMLLIHERLYTGNVRKQSCTHVFLLMEKADFQIQDQMRDTRCRYLYKYSSLKEIFFSIAREVRLEEQNSGSGEIDRTKLYVTCSVTGGCGKTVSSLGFANALSQRGEKVLYINMEAVQDFAWYLEQKSCASQTFAYALAIHRDNLAELIQQEVGHEGFDYLRPIDKVLLSYQINGEAYVELVGQLIRERSYDAIILEASRELEPSLIKLFERADRILMFCTQNAESSYKLERFLAAFSRREEQWLFICSKYLPGRENCLKRNISMGMLDITEYVPMQEREMDLKRIRERGYFSRTAYMLE